MTTTTDTLLADLRKAHAAMLDPHDLPHTWTSRQVDAYEQKRMAMARTISGLRNIDNDLEKPLRLLAECEARKAVVLERERDIQQQIADAQDWQSIRDGRERDREHDRQRDLERQRRALDEGTLIIAPGIVAERLVDLDQRIGELEQRIATIRARHDTDRSTAERLIGETVTS